MTSKSSSSSSEDAKSLHYSLLHCLRTSPSIDLWYLRSLALHHGFECTDGSLRREAWEALLDVGSIVDTYDDEDDDSQGGGGPVEDDTKEQVKRDVDRSLWNLLPSTTQRLGNR